MAASSSLMNAALMLTSSRNFLSIVSRTTQAPAQATGFIPKVEPWSPGTSTSHVLGPQMMPPIGRPAPIPLAKDTMSGCIPYCSKANSVPVLPIPACTSSSMKSMSFSLHRSAAACTKSLSSACTPPSPWTSSIMKAHGSYSSASAFSNSMLSTSAWTKPGTSGANTSCASASPVAVTVARVRPWNDFFSEMIVFFRWFARTLPYFLAVLIAASLASPPEFANQTLHRPLLSTSFSASMTPGSE